MKTNISKGLLTILATITPALPAQEVGAEGRMEELPDFSVRDYTSYNILEAEDSLRVPFRKLDSNGFDVDATVYVDPEGDDLSQYSMAIFVGQPGKERKVILDFDGDMVNDGNALLRGTFSTRAFGYDNLDVLEDTYNGKDVERSMFNRTHPAAEGNTSECKIVKIPKKKSKEALEVCLVSSDISSERDDIVAGTVAYYDELGRLGQRSFFEGSGVTRAIIVGDYVGGSRNLELVIATNYVLPNAD